MVFAQFVNSKYLNFKLHRLSFLKTIIMMIFGTYYDQKEWNVSIELRVFGIHIFSRTLIIFLICITLVLDEPHQPYLSSIMQINLFIIFFVRYIFYDFFAYVLVNLWMLVWKLEN